MVVGNGQRARRQKMFARRCFGLAQGEAPPGIVYRTDAADELNRRGIRTASGRQWHAMQVASCAIASAYALTGSFETWA